MQIINQIYTFILITIGICIFPIMISLLIFSIFFIIQKSVNWMFNLLYKAIKILSKHCKPIRGLSKYIDTIKDQNLLSLLIYLWKTNTASEDRIKSISKLLNSIIKYNWKKICFQIIIFCALISYWNEITILIDRYWVNIIIKYLNKYETFEYAILFTPLVIYYYRKISLNKAPNIYNSIIIMFLILLMIFGVWIFEIKAIIFIVTYGIFEIVHIKSFFSKYEERDKDNSSIFAIDTPLKSNEENKEDSLGREHLIKTSAENLRNGFFDKGAFYIAVTGEWGSGKTSFTNLLTDKMISDEKDIIKIEINTWRTEDPNLFTKYFFDTLNKELSVYIPELSRLLPKYLAIVANSCDNKYLKGASKILDSFSNNNNDPYESIKNVLIKAKKKIIVVIDDIDRLNAEEIYQILKLVRNTVDFPYMQFIMNFDKEYVVDCLGKFICEDKRNVIEIDNKKVENKESNSKIFNTDTHNKKAQNYLEKFIHMEIYLTPFESSTIPLCFYELLCDNGYKHLADELKGLIERNFRTAYPNNTSEGFTKINNEEKVKDYKNITLLGETISSMRNLKKLYNSFMNSYLTIKKSNIDIQITQLFLIELLKLNDIKIYKILSNNPVSLLNTIGNDKLLFQLNENSHKTLNRISNEILNELFSSKSPSENSIQYLSNFDIYFYLRNSKSIITYSNLLQVINQDNINTHEIIKEWKNNMTENGICYRIREFLEIFYQNNQENEYNKLYLLIYNIIDNKSLKLNNLLPEYNPEYRNQNIKFLKYDIEIITKLIKKDENMINQTSINNFCENISIWSSNHVQNFYSLMRFLIKNTEFNIYKLFINSFKENLNYTRQEYEIYFKLLKDAYNNRKKEDLKSIYYDLLSKLIRDLDKNINTKPGKKQYLELIKEFLSDKTFLKKCQFDNITKFLNNNNIRIEINNWENYLLVISLNLYLGNSKTNRSFLIPKENFLKNELTIISIYLYIQKEVNYKIELRNIISQVIDEPTFNNMLKEINQHSSDFDEADIKEISQLRYIYEGYRYKR